MTEISPDEFKPHIFHHPGTIERSGKAKKFSVRGGKMIPTSQYPSFMTRPKNNKKGKKRK